MERQWKESKEKKWKLNANPTLAFSALLRIILLKLQNIFLSNHQEYFQPESIDFIEE